MPEFKIPCEVYVRLSGLTDTIYHDGSPYCKTVRIEDGKAIVTNRKVIAIEMIGGPVGAGHIIVDPVLVEQCKREAPFDSVLIVTLDHTMKFASAKTTFGYAHPANVGYWGPPGIENELDRWKTIIPANVAKASSGAMLWDAAVIAALGASSPTGGLVFPEYIDVSQPVIIRDATDDRWCGIFLPRARDAVHAGALVPEWLR